MVVPQGREEATDESELAPIQAAARPAAQKLGVSPEVGLEFDGELCPRDGGDRRLSGAETAGLSFSNGSIPFVESLGKRPVRSRQQVRREAIAASHRSADVRVSICSRALRLLCVGQREHARLQQSTAIAATVPLVRADVNGCDQTVQQVTGPA